MKIIYTIINTAIFLIIKSIKIVSIINNRERSKEDNDKSDNKNNSKSNSKDVRDNENWSYINVNNKEKVKKVLEILGW